MSEAGSATPDAGKLRERAEELREIARLANVMAGTLAHSNLERARTDVEQAIEALQREDAPFWAIAERLKGIGISLELALYWSGTGAADGPSVPELQQRLEAWFEGG